MRRGRYRKIERTAEEIAFQITEVQVCAGTRI